MDVREVRAAVSLVRDATASTVTIKRDDALISCSRCMSRLSNVIDEVGAATDKNAAEIMTIIKFLAAKLELGLNILKCFLHLPDGIGLRRNIIPYYRLPHGSYKSLAILLEEYKAAAKRNATEIRKAIIASGQLIHIATNTIGPRHMTVKFPLLIDVLSQDVVVARLNRQITIIRINNICGRSVFSHHG